MGVNLSSDSNVFRNAKEVLNSFSSPETKKTIRVAASTLLFGVCIGAGGYTNLSFEAQITCGLSSGILGISYIHEIASRYLFQKNNDLQVEDEDPTDRLATRAQEEPIHHEIETADEDPINALGTGAQEEVMHGEIEPVDEDVNPSAIDSDSDSIFTLSDIEDDSDDEESTSFRDAINQELQSTDLLLAEISRAGEDIRTDPHMNLRSVALEDGISPEGTEVAL